MLATKLNDGPSGLRRFPTNWQLQRTEITERLPHHNIQCCYKFTYFLASLHTWIPKNKTKKLKKSDALSALTVYPKKYAHGFCFPVLCCGYTLTGFPISIRLTLLALWQSNDCPNASKATLMNTSCEFIMNDCITTTKQSTTKPCAYFLGYTVWHFIIKLVPLCKKKVLSPFHYPIIFHKNIFGTQEYSHFRKTLE